MKRIVLLFLCATFIYAGCDAHSTKDQVSDDSTAESGKVNLTVKTDQLIQKGRDRLNLGTKSIRDIAQAMQYFKEAIGTNPFDQRGYLLLGKTYMNVGSYNDAIFTFQSALLVFPEDGLFNYLLSMCFFQLEDNGMATYNAQKSMDKYKKSKNIDQYKKSKKLFNSLLINSVRPQ